MGVGKICRRIGMVVLALVALAAAAAVPAGAAQPMISAGGEHTCAVVDLGAVWCWGDNSLGQLGDGTTTSSPVPLQVVGLPAAAQQVAAGRDSTCALLVGRSVWCWGGNTHGQLGIGTMDVLATPHPVPVPVAGAVNPAAISGGERTFCVSTFDETAICWGSNEFGEVGNPAAGSVQVDPTAAASLNDVGSVSVGYRHACAHITNGTAMCWGDNTNGRLGDGTTTSSPSAVPVVNLSTVAWVFAGGNSSCALVGVGLGRCWGAAGMIGNGSAAPSLTPKSVDTIAGAARIGGSAAGQCAINAGQSLVCWGARVGNGNASTVLQPVSVATGPGVLAISANGYSGHFCYALRGGEADCWGDNNVAGKLGNGAVGDQPVLRPVRVAGLDLVIGVYSSTRITMRRVGKVTLDKRRRNYLVKGVLSAKLPMLVGPIDGCTGHARIAVAYSYKAKKRVSGKTRSVSVTKSASAKARFKSVADTCETSVRLKLPVKRLSGKSVRLSGSWPGNSSIKPIKANSAKFKLAKPKSRRR